MEDAAARVVTALLQEADEAHREGRFDLGLAAAKRALVIAIDADDPALLVQALEMESGSYRQLGDKQAAFTGATRILGLVEDLATRDRITGFDAEQAVARARLEWVEAARSILKIRTRDLFPVLEEAERSIRTSGKSQWIADVLASRALSTNGSLRVRSCDKLGKSRSGRVEAWDSTIAHAALEFSGMPLPKLDATRRPTPTSTKSWMTSVPQLPCRSRHWWTCPDALRPTTT